MKNELYFGFDDEAKQVTELIDRMGALTPMVLAIREVEKNGLESNERFFQAHGYSKREVLFRRDWRYPQKLSVINIDGDYLSPEIAKKHLGTIANSGNWNSISKILGLAPNFGQGVKISYITKVKLGIEYRSKSHDGEGIRFIIRKLNNGQYGFQNLWDEELEEWVSFQRCESFGPELSAATSGTEVVFLGNSEEEDTWNVFSTACSLTGRDSQSGQTIRDWLGSRNWEEVSTHSTRVMTYETGVKDINSNIYKVKCLKNDMQKEEMSGQVPLNGYVGIPDGTVAYWSRVYNRTETGGNKISSLDRGIVGFAWKKEVYYEHDYNQNIRYLKSCGIFAKPSSFVIVFELPGDYNATPTDDRTSLKNIKKELYFEAFRENIPDEILQFLRDQIVVHDKEEDIKKYLKNKFQDNFLPKPVRKKSSAHPKSSGRKNSGKFNSNKGSKRTDVQWNLKYHVFPDFQLIECDDSPLVRFDYVGDYCIRVNSMHTLFTKRCDKIKKEFPNILKDEVSTIVYRQILVGVLSRIREIQTLTDEFNFDSRMKMLTPEILEATWTITTEENIKRSLRNKNNIRKKVGLCTENEETA